MGPAASVDALLAAFASLGLDAAAIRREAGLSDRIAEPGSLVASGVWRGLWDAAAVQAPRPELPTETGLAVPFGAFGIVDYLAGSAATVRDGMRALAAHFGSISATYGLSFEADPRGGGILRVSSAPDGAIENDEFTIAVVLGRFRGLTGGQFGARTAWLTRETVRSRHAALFGAPVGFGASSAGLDLDAASLDAPLVRADVRLHETLAGLAVQLGLASGLSGIEFAVRAQLRSILPGAWIDACGMAHVLGMAERTLHRRLAKHGRRYRDIVDSFRAAEADRLLLQGRLRRSEIAVALGFSDQSAWNRAFRRWKGTTPTAWLARRRAELDGCSTQPG